MATRTVFDEESDGILFVRRFALLLFLFSCRSQPWVISPQYKGGICRDESKTRNYSFSKIPWSFFELSAADDAQKQGEDDPHTTHQ